MEAPLGTILTLKARKIAPGFFDRNGKPVDSAIGKEPVERSFLAKEGFREDDQADKKHHGGEHKALLFLSLPTFEAINRHGESDLDPYENAWFGENVLLSATTEEEIAVGDLLKVGGAVVEVSQPREPCWKLSARSGVKEMTKIIYRNGFTGWYVRVVEEGEVAKGDQVVRIGRTYPELTVAYLNRLIQDPSADPSGLEKALACPKLAPAFKESLEKRVK